jgi:hypothetical protein
MNPPCNFDHNGECLICDCWVSECAYLRMLAHDYKWETKEQLEEMFKDYKRGDSGTIGEELLQGVPDLELKCMAIESSVREGYFKQSEALALYQVSEGEYNAYLNKTNTMNSPHTGKPMPLHVFPRYLEFKDESFRVYYLYYICTETGEEYTNEDLDNVNLYQVYQQYAEKHNLPLDEVMPK